MTPPTEALLAAAKLQWEWLVRLDEHEVACRFLANLPYVLEGHPDIARMQAISAETLGHCVSAETYAAAYDTIWEANTPQTIEGILAAATVGRFHWALTAAKTLGAQSVLDMGAGNGGLALLLAAHGIPAMGLNLTQRCVAPAAEVAVRLGLPATFVYGHAEDIDVPADIVVAFEIVEHVRDPAALITSMTRNARRLCMLTTPHGSTCEGKDMWAEWGHGFFDPYGPVIAHIRVYTEARVRALLAGQANVMVQRVGATLIATWTPHE